MIVRGVSLEKKFHELISDLDASKGMVFKMIVKQLSVFLENASGHFLKLSTCLGKADVNINALSLAESAEYGIARMILDDVEKGAAVLSEAGYNVKITNVLQLSISDTPGSLGTVLVKLAEGNVNVSYIYGYSANGAANLILRVDDPEHSLKLLEPCE